MSLYFNLIITKGKDTIGFYPLNPDVIDDTYYLQIKQEKQLVEEFDIAKSPFMKVNSNFIKVNIHYLDENRNEIMFEALDLSQYQPLFQNKTEDDRLRDLAFLVREEMENPKGLTALESQKHTDMMQNATSLDNAKNYVTSKMTQVLLASGKVNESEVGEITYKLFAELYGMGVLQELDDDPEMGEIMVNAVTFPKFHCDIYYIKNGVKYKYDRAFQTLEELKKVFNRTVMFEKTEINNSSHARIECSRPNRDRVNIIVPDASDNWSMNIRKFTNFVPNLSMMKKAGTVDDFIDKLMDMLVRGKANIGIGGAMGTGKTTFINYLLAYTPPIERKVVIASVSETDVDRVLKGHDVVIFNVNEKKGFTFQELLRTSLRTTADRVIIPESRGGEFKELYEANLKTKGNMFTAHALDDESFMDMCVDMYLSSPDVSGNESAEFLKNKISKALDIVVINRRVGSKIVLKSISEVLQSENGQYIGMNCIYEWAIDPDDPLKGHYVRTTNRLSDGIKKRLNEQGITAKELEEY